MLRFFSSFFPPQEIPDVTIWEEAITLSSFMVWVGGPIFCSSLFHAVSHCRISSLSILLCFFVFQASQFYRVGNFPQIPYASTKRSTQSSKNGWADLIQADTKECSKSSHSGNDEDK